MKKEVTIKVTRTIVYDGAFCSWDCEWMDPDNFGVLPYKIHNCTAYKVGLSNLSKKDYVTDGTGHKFKNKMYRCDKCLKKNP